MSSDNVSLIVAVILFNILRSQQHIRVVILCDQALLLMG